MFPKKMAQDQAKAKAKVAPKGKAAAAKPAAEGLKKGEFEKIPGTEIKQMKGGVTVRVATKSGVQFDPKSLKAVKKHLTEIGVQWQPAQPQKKKKQPKEKKILTPEQIAEKRKKNEEALAKVLKAENRNIVAQKFHKGEVVNRCGFHAWVKPTNLKDIPFEVEQKMKVMNNEMRAKAKEGKAIEDNVLYVRVSDIADEKFRADFKKGTVCQFKLYTDSKGVGGCQVKA